MPVVGSNCNKLTALITPRSDETFPGGPPARYGRRAPGDRTFTDRCTAKPDAFYGRLFSAPPCRGIGKRSALKFLSRPRAHRSRVSIGRARLTVGGLFHFDAVCEFDRTRDREFHRVTYTAPSRPRALERKVGALPARGERIERITDETGVCPCLIGVVRDNTIFPDKVPDRANDCI